MPRISALPDGAGTIATTNQLPTNQSGTTRRVTLANVRDLLLTNTLLHNDAKPSSPHAKDDYFDDAVASAAKWTLWNPGSNTSVAYTAAARKAVVSNTGNGSDRYGGIYQAAPSSQFTVAAHVSVACPDALGDYHAAGLFVSNDIVGSPTTAPFLIGCVANGVNDAFVGTQTWADYNGAATNVKTRSISGFDSMFVRIRVNATAVEVDLSVNGSAWQRVSSSTLAYTPIYFGLAALATPNSTRADGVFRFVRVFDGVSAFADVPELGRLFTHGQ